MREISLLELEQQSSQGGAPGDKDLAKHKDWLFRILGALAAVVLITALIAGLLLALRYFVPGVDEQLAIVPVLEQESIAFPAITLESVGISIASSTLNWPAGLGSGPVLVAGLLIVAVALLLISRWRLVGNRSMQSSAGCPSCQEERLIRVHRIGRDRLLAMSGIPFGRYQCRNCQWNGRRIRNGRGPHVGSSRKSSSRQVSNSEIAARPATITGSWATDVRDSSVRVAHNGSGVQVPLSADAAIASKKESVADSTAASDVVENTSPQAVSPQEAAADESFNDSLPTFAAWEAALPQEERLQNTAVIEEQASVAPARTARIVAPLAVNLRENPVSNGVLLDTLEPDTIVMLLNDVEQDKDVTWQHVQVNNQKGWVLGAFLGSCK